LKYNKWPKRDPIKNYFPLPNEVFSLGLTTGEIAVYTYLMYCEDRDTWQCWPSYKTIGRAVGMSKKTVQKYVEMLVDKGLILTERTDIYTKEGLKLNGNLRYTIRPIHEAVQIFREKQMQKIEEENVRARMAMLAAEQNNSFRWEEEGA